MEFYDEILEWIYEKAKDLSDDELQLLTGALSLNLMNVATQLEERIRRIRLADVDR